MNLKSFDPFVLAVYIPSSDHGILVSFWFSNHCFSTEKQSSLWIYEGLEPMTFLLYKCNWFPSSLSRKLLFFCVCLSVWMCVCSIISEQSHSVQLFASEGWALITTNETISNTVFLHIPLCRSPASSLPVQGLKIDFSVTLTQSTWGWNASCVGNDDNIEHRKSLIELVMLPSCNTLDHLHQQALSVVVPMSCFPLSTSFCQPRLKERRERLKIMCEQECVWVRARMHV